MGNFPRTASFATGKMAKMRVWNKELSAAEVAAIYAGNESDVKSYMVGAWDFEEQSGTVIYNKVANSDHGTFSGTTGSQWVLDTSGKIPPNTIRQGFRLASGVQIPILNSGASAANGAAITNPAIAGYNFGTCTLEIDDEIAAIRAVDNLFTTPFFYNSATPGDIRQFDPSSDIVANYESANKLTATITGSTSIINFRLKG
jgi:hypothetical protein